MIRNLLLLALPLAAMATYGVDVSQPHSQSVFNCMVNNGYKFAIVRVYQSNGKCDPNGPSSINNAWKGGMSYVDGYIFPCYSCGNPAKQMSDTIAYLKSHQLHVATEGDYVANVHNEGNLTSSVGATVGMLWLDIEGTQYWSSNQASNVNFIQAMVDEGKRQGVVLGIYSSKSQWDPITGGSTKFSYLPIWYAHYDNWASFGDWKNFGGWTKPAIKQYAGTTAFCGGSVDKNFY